MHLINVLLSSKISKLIHQTNDNQQRLEEGKESHSTMILIASKSVYFGIDPTNRNLIFSSRWEARARPMIIVKASAYKLPSRSLPQSARIECKPSGPSDSWRKKFITRFMNMRQTTVIAVLSHYQPWIQEGINVLATMIEQSNDVKLPDDVEEPPESQEIVLLSPSDGAWLMGLPAVLDAVLTPGDVFKLFKLRKLAWSCKQIIHITNAALELAQDSLAKQEVTSNRHPDELYKNGIKWESFLGRIKLIKRRTRVIDLNSGTDYRKQLGSSAGGLLTVFLSPISAENRAEFAKRFNALTDHEPILENRLLPIWGTRHILVPLSTSSVACFDFNQLCASCPVAP
ncbi:hypothetical protein PGTUg99_002149 [Puccinia graminis f. sp. tritici]|uniref:Uncharacterized protein n=1 Tax=Puccinia graminis f. sp. tritici TaxID=56615 RepID=A0A5B0RQA0_PUCGR|nr:hypothetical protein PGTUg99_002149 [Puccinia graminis f. sp. tritici]